MRTPHSRRSCRQPSQPDSLASWVPTSRLAANFRCRFWPASALAAAAALLTAGAAGADHDEAPPSSSHYIQYGVAITGEAMASDGDVCQDGPTPCIIGSGGGLAIRVGYRSRGPWYTGGAYEFARLDASNLLRPAILQQLRAETRYYPERGKRLVPYGTAGVGAALYGNEWGWDTGGVIATAGAGLEFQITQATVIGAALTYRPLLLRGWTDSAGERRADRFLGFGFAHFIGLELVLEVREPLPRW
jgi:hypothetical protein